jgi:hypothetical protein
MLHIYRYINIKMEYKIYTYSTGYEMHIYNIKY